MKVSKGGGGWDCWGYSRFRLWEGGDGGGEVVEISPVHVYTSIMGKGVYKTIYLVCQGHDFDLTSIMICHIQISKWEVSCRQGNVT